MVPAHAGMVPICLYTWSTKAGGPRARGDGPHTGIPAGAGTKWSPRTRGWSLGEQERLPVVHVVPAPAGMVPS